MNREEKFNRQLLMDIKALEIMIESGMIESGVNRIGAEQELYIVDDQWRAKPEVKRVLKALRDPHFSVEIAKFNIEINLDPLPFVGDCLASFERQINSLIARLNCVAGDMKLRTVMVGILPTIRKSDLSPENLIDDPRYQALCAILNEERRGPYVFRIKGVDELIASHNTPMFESCNTSFQVHFQVSPESAVNLYNISQAVAAPVLASAVNSPLLLGKRLWKETRVALFQQAVDTRVGSYHSREKSPRVTFGTKWIRDSILEIFYDNVARYKVLISPEVDEDSLGCLNEGRIPPLSALQIYNGTVWRWNRLCYGLTDGVPHLRIENRVLPSGPTVRDEVSNAAFWLGLMKGMPEIYPDISGSMEFDFAKENFINAARTALDARFKWVEGKTVRADELILGELLPVAREGLRSANVLGDDIDLYLGIIEERVSTGRTGSRWIIDSFNELRKRAHREEAIVALTAGMYKRQMKGDPVHMWTKAELEDAGRWLDRCRHVEQVMSTDLFVVMDSDLIDLAVCIMDWKHIRHVPVEDGEGRFAGLLTSGILLKHYGSGAGRDVKPVLVRDIMIKEPITVSPGTKTVDAVSIMHENKIGCLPVVDNDTLVGIVTEHDFMNLSANLLKEISEAGGAAVEGKE